MKDSPAKAAAALIIPSPNNNNNKSSTSTPSLQLTTKVSSPRWRRLFSKTRRDDSTLLASPAQPHNVSTYSDATRHDTTSSPVKRKPQRRLQEIAGVQSSMMNMQRVVPDDLAFSPEQRTVMLRRSDTHETSTGVVVPTMVTGFAGEPIGTRGKARLATYTRGMYRFEVSPTMAPRSNSSEVPEYWSSQVQVAPSLSQSREPLPAAGIINDRSLVLTSTDEDSPDIQLNVCSSDEETHDVQAKWWANAAAVKRSDIGTQLDW